MALHHVAVQPQQGGGLLKGNPPYGVAGARWGSRRLETFDDLVSLPAPSGDRAIVLRIFEGLGATPGRFVPVTTLFLNWAPSLGNVAFADAVEGLARDFYLVAGEHGTQYALTEAGYAVRQGGAGMVPGAPQTG